MGSQALVSVVIPSYNHARYVQESIQSVIDQDYENIELIIIDDGSKDNSVEVINEMVDACQRRFVRFEFRHRPNKGLCATLNEAIDWMEGDFFSALASDDVIVPAKTSIQVDFLKSNIDSIGVFGAIETILKSGKSILSIGKKENFDFNQIFLRKHNLPAPTSMIRMSDVRRVGGYPLDRIIEDWSMWLRLTECGGYLSYINIKLAIYRRHGDNISAKLDKMLEGRLQVMFNYQYHPLYNKASSMVYMTQAREVQVKNKIKSVCYAVISIRFYPFVVFKKMFIGYLGKFIFKKESFLS